MVDHDKLVLLVRGILTLNSFFRFVVEWVYVVEWAGLLEEGVYEDEGD